MTKVEIIEYLKAHKVEFSRKFNIEKIALFGSYARGDETKNSDIDILIELKSNTKNVYSIKKELKEFLTNAFKKDVDIARIKYLQPYYKKEILKDSIFV
jgi:predicted nucleotidyltransferase